MKFLSVRELRNRPGQVWEDALRDDLVITSNGKPVGLLIGVPEGELEQTLLLVRRARAAAAVSSMRRRAVQQGTARLSRRAVDAEIRAARRAPGVRIVLDTNVLVSGLLNPHGAPGRIVDLVLEGTLTLLVDDRVLAEYQGVLTRPRFGFEAGDVGAVIDFIDVSAERVPSVPLRLTALDPDDTAFICPLGTRYRRYGVRHALALVSRSFDPAAAGAEVRAGRGFPRVARA